MKDKKLELTVKNKYGLHARPASMLVKTAISFSSNIKIEKEGSIFDAKSLISILAHSIEYDSKITLHISGSDAKEAEEAINNLFNCKEFNES